MTINHNNQAVKVNLVLSSAPKRRGEEVDRAWEVVGLRLEPVLSQTIQTYRTQYQGSLTVTAVRPSSPAFRQRESAKETSWSGCTCMKQLQLDNIEQITKRPDIVSQESGQILHPARRKVVRVVLRPSTGQKVGREVVSG